MCYCLGTAMDDDGLKFESIGDRMEWEDEQKVRQFIGANLSKLHIDNTAWNLSVCRFAYITYNYPYFFLKYAWRRPSNKHSNNSKIPYSLKKN